MHLKDIF